MLACIMEETFSALAEIVIFETLHIVHCKSLFKLLSVWRFVNENRAI